MPEQLQDILQKKLDRNLRFLAGEQVEPEEAPSIIKSEPIPESESRLRASIGAELQEQLRRKKSTELYNQGRAEYWTRKAQEASKGPVYGGPFGGGVVGPLVMARYYETGGPEAHKISPEMIEAGLQNIGGMGLPVSAGGYKAHPWLSALGGAAGESTYQIYEALTGKETAPKNWKEAGLRMLAAGGLQGFAEWLSGKGMQFLAPGIDIPVQDREALRYAAQHGVHLTPAQMKIATQKYAGFESIAQSALIGGRKFRLFKQAEARKLSNVKDMILESVGKLQPEEGARLISDLVDNKYATQRAIEAAKHSDWITEAGSDYMVSTKPIREMAAAAEKQLSPTIKKSVTMTNYPMYFKGHEFDEPIMPSLNTGKLLTIVKEAQTLPDKLPLEVLKNRRTALGNLIFDRQADDIFTSADRRVLENLYFSWMKAYENPVHGLPPKAIPLLKDANKFSTQFHRDFEDKIIKSIWHSHPEALERWISKNPTMTRIETLQRVLGPDAIDPLKRVFVTDLLTNKAIKKNVETGELYLSGLDLTNFLQVKLGPKKGTKLLGSELYDELNQFARALTMQQSHPGERGSVFIQLKQAGGITTLVLLPLSAGGVAYATTRGLPTAAGVSAGTFIMTPAMIGSLFRNRVLLRYLRSNMLGKPSFANGLRAISHISAELAKDKLTEKFVTEEQEEGPPGVFGEPLRKQLK